MYALCGFYFTDSAAFEAGIRELESSPMTIDLQDGCQSLFGSEIAGVVRNEKALKVDEGLTLEQAIAVALRAGPPRAFDIAGGAHPLRLAGAEVTAPRSPL